MLRRPVRDTNVTGVVDMREQPTSRVGECDYSPWECMESRQRVFDFVRKEDREQAKCKNNGKDFVNGRRGDRSGSSKVFI